MTEESKPYDPLSTTNIGESLVNQFAKMKPTRIDQLQPFAGAGVYGLYYTGSHPAYTRIVTANADGAFQQPIYIGKAIPSGGRKGTVAFGEVSGKYIHDRLKQHAASLEAAKDLDIRDFFVRWLIVEPIWIALTETLLINRSLCVWNMVLDGFGNKDPGKKRHGGQRTKWDTMHPGRWYGELATPSVKFDQQSLTQEVITWINQRV